MGRIFSNGALKDFVIEPFEDSVSGSTQISIMSPFVTRVDDLVGCHFHGEVDCVAAERRERL